MRGHRDIYDWAGTVVIVFWLATLLVIVAGAVGWIDLPEAGNTKYDYDYGPYWYNTPPPPPPVPDVNPFTPF